jgi:hypothetical protein
VTAPTRSGLNRSVAAPRVLYVPTEEGDFRQVGLRRPLGNLRDAGLIEDVSVFSLRWRTEQGGDPEAHRADLVRRIAEFRPTTVLMQHLGGTGLRDRHFRAMRRAGDFRLIYHEGDPYALPLHPLPLEARAAGRAADVVFTTGSGAFVRNFQRLGARDVRYEPSAFDVERFPRRPVDPVAQRPHDVVVVANRNRPRWRGHPDWRRRIGFVRRLQERFADRLAIFGNGWDGPGTRGPVEFSQQVDAIRSGWVTANWDHYAREPKYFSNRLAISLSCGTVHATTRHPGYDELFPAETRDFLLLEAEPDALVDRIEQYLAATTPEMRIAASEQAQEFAYEHLRQDDQLVRFLDTDGPHIDPAAARDSWDIAAAPLAET